MIKSCSGRILRLRRRIHFGAGDADGNLAVSSARPPAN